MTNSSCLHKYTCYFFFFSCKPNNTKCVTSATWEREPEGLRFCYALDVELNFLHIKRERRSESWGAISIGYDLFLALTWFSSTVLEILLTPVARKRIQGQYLGSALAKWGWWARAPPQQWARSPHSLESRFGFRKSVRAVRESNQWGQCRQKDCFQGYLIILLGKSQFWLN